MSAKISLPFSMKQYFSCAIFLILRNVTASIPHPLVHHTFHFLKSIKNLLAAYQHVIEKIFNRFVLSHYIYIIRFFSLLVIMNNLITSLCFLTVSTLFFLWTCQISLHVSSSFQCCHWGEPKKHISLNTVVLLFVL